MIDGVSSSISPWWQGPQTQQVGANSTSGAGADANSSAFSLASLGGGAGTSPTGGPASPSLQMPTDLFLMLQTGAVDGTSGASSSSGGASTGTTASSTGDLFSQLQSLLDSIENDLSTGAAADGSDPLPQANGATDPTQTNATRHHHHHHSASGSDPTGAASDQSAASALTGTQSS